MKRILFAALAVLAGCGAVVPGEALRLSWISPIESDPEGWRAVVTLPEGVEVAEGGAVLTLGATRETDGAEVGRSFGLDERQEGAASAFAISPGDLDAFRALQAKIRTWKSIWPRETRGTLSVKVALCETGAGPARDATFDVALAVEPGTTPRPILRRASVAEALGSAGAGRCSSP